MYGYDELDELLLNRPLSATSDADPDDVLSAKSAFTQLGFYETPSYGLTPYPDQTLFDGIRDYQKKNGLAVDGYMLPGGETEQSVNNTLATQGRNAKNGSDDQTCAEPAVQWWQLPPWGMPRKRDYCPTPAPGDRPTEEECERQAVRDDATCTRIYNRYGAYRARRCFESADLRYGNCKAGHWNFPELDTGEY